MSAVQQEQRHWKRKRKHFWAAYSLTGDVFVAAYGLDISHGGLSILLRGELPEGDALKVRISLGARDFIVDARKTWQKPVPYQGETWLQTGLRFVMIGPVDRECVDCYIDGKPFYEGNKLLEQLAQVRQHPDRADSLLPAELLTALHERLIAMERLARLAPGESPLVKYRYDGPREHRGKRVHLMTIESKLVRDGHPYVFTTRLTFDDHGKHIEVAGTVAPIS